jgi:hypothetical protein
VVRVVVLSFRNLLAKGAFAAQMIDLGLPQIVQNLKAQAWTDEVRSFPNLCFFNIPQENMHRMLESLYVNHCFN